MCADPLTCELALYPNSKDVFRFLLAWCAGKGIFLVVMRRREKKMKASGFETLYNTSLCKVIQWTYDTDAAYRMLQIDLQRWLRTGIRQLRQNAPAESPCNYGYLEQMIHQILHFVGEGGFSEHADGTPFLYDDHLHLAEWQALQ